MEQDPALSLCRRLLARCTFALARAVEMAVDGGAGDVEEVRDLLDGPIASVVELLREDGLVWCSSTLRSIGALTRNVERHAGW